MVRTIHFAFLHLPFISIILSFSFNCTSCLLVSSYGWGEESLYMEVFPRNVNENSSTSCYFVFHEIVTNKSHVNDIIKITAFPLKLTSQLPPSPVTVAKNISNCLNSILYFYLQCLTSRILWLETKELFTI